MRALFGLLALLAAPVAHAGTLAQDFVHPPAEARPMVRWWWFGGAVTDAELGREIKAMKAGGFGGFEIQPVYPLTLDDPASGLKNEPYLSDDFLKHVRFANVTGRAEGLRVDVTLGSGWPFGGPHITADLASSAIKLTKITVAANATDADISALTAGQHFVAAFIGTDMATATPLKAAPGHVTLTPEARERTLFVVLQTPTGQQVKRPTVGAEGNVLDHMKAAAVQRHLSAVGDRLMTAFADAPPYSVFSDSLEVYSADWTDDVLPEFAKRRGYDLKPHLLDLFQDTPQSAAVRHDWGLTLSELVDENYLTPVTEWAKAHGTKFRSQTYGQPPVTLSSNRLIALPEGEGPQWRRFSTSRWASSANHIYGNPVTSAESWTWLHAGAFRATPLDIKAEADTLMLEGINQFIAHGWPYSPPQVPEPGWAFYAAAVFNDHNPWWGVMPDVTAYLQRMSFLMRQGEPVADVAIFLPEDDAFAAMRPGDATVNGQMQRYVTDTLTAQILDAGYAFDYVDAQSIEAKGVGHKVLILPNVTRLTPKTAAAIAAFARSGGIVVAVGRLPDSGAGLLNAEADTKVVKAMSAALFPSGPVSESAVGAALKAATTQDVSGLPEGVGFVHRHIAGGDIYFVANTNNQQVTMQPAFRAQNPRSQWWEPKSGTAHNWTSGSTVMLAPYESRIFVFGAAASVPTVAEARAVKAMKMDLSGGWTIAFAGQKPQPLTNFKGWDTGPATANFSGTATYARTLTLTKAQIASGPVVLDFGEGQPAPPPPARANGTAALLDAPVRDAAEVFVNGKRAGAVWSAPFTISLKGLVHPGANRLEIRVANTAINALSARPPVDYSALNAKYGERFQAQNMSNLKPLPSGLLQTPVLERPQ